MNETKALALTGRLFDGHQLHARATVLMQGDKVLDVTTQDAPADTQVIHLQPDEMILPGLVDLHVHARDRYASWFLQAGVTSVRDAGGSLNELKLARDWAAAGTGPRVYGAGTILDGENSVFRHFGEGALTEIGDPNAGGWIIRTPQDAVKAVDLLQAAGACTVKLYEQLPPDAYAAAAAHARKCGLPVMTDLGMRITRALSGAQVDALQALKCGVQTIEHASGFALAFQRLGFDPSTDFPDEQTIQKFAQAIVDAGAVLVPTLSVMEGGRHEQRRDLGTLPASHHDDEVAHSLRAQWDRMHEYTTKVRAAHDWDARLAAALARHVTALGGKVGAGTDTPAGVDNLPGGGLHAELEYLVKYADFTPLQALQAATGTANEIVDAGRGIIAKDSVADAVIVRGDPTRDITATREIQQVIFDGKILKS